MKLLTSVPLLLTVLTSFSLSAQTVKSKLARQGSLCRLQIHAWKKSTFGLPEFFTQFVKPDVDAQLAAKSLRQLSAAQKPDLFVTYHVQTQESPASNTTRDGFRAFSIRP